jgi:hypothetical protein
LANQTESYMMEAVVPIGKGGIMFNVGRIGSFVLLLVLVSACSGLPGPAGDGDLATGVGEPDPDPMVVPDTPVTSPTASATSTPTATDLPSHPLISVSMDTNCRQGPGQVYDYLGSLKVGETAEVFGRDPTGKFWFIRNPDAPGYCWVWGEYATLVGDTAPLPVYTPEPTPTPAPGFTFAFKTVEMCAIARSIEFTVTNTGAVTWESYNLFVEDTTLSLSDTFSDDVFADVHACGCDYFDLALVPGQTGSLGSRLFIDHHPSGESFYAELTLCSQDGLTGQCVTQSITFVVP